MKHYIVCKSCGKRITRLLNSEVVLADFTQFVNEPLLLSCVSVQ